MRISDWSSDVCSSDRRRLVDVDEQYVVLVVDLEIPALQRQAARAEAVIPGDQLVGDLRIPDALADLAGDEFADEGVRFLVDQNVAEIAHPDAETRFGIQLLPKRRSEERRVGKRCCSTCRAWR